jgi:hypothetical protein
MPKTLVTVWYYRISLKTPTVIYAASYQKVALEAKYLMHLLAWYNGIIRKMSNTAGLYRYDPGSKTMARVIPQSALGAVTLFSACAAVAHGCS